MKNNVLKVDEFISRILRCHIISILFFIYTLLLGAYFFYGKTIGNTTCDLIRMKIEQISTPLSRELMLESSLSGAIFKQFEKDMSASFGNYEGRLIQKNNLIDKNSSIQYSCSYTFNSLSFEYPFIFAGDHVGSIRGKYIPVSIYVQLAYFLSISILVFMITGHLRRKIFLQLNENLIVPLKKLTEGTSSFPPFMLAEVNDIYQDLVNYKSKQQEYFKVQYETKKVDELSKLAAQVSHDIRSPLVALEMLGQDLAFFPEEKRVMMREAINRIKDIANTLLEKRRYIALMNDASDMNNSSSLVLLSCLIDSVVSEKNIQMRNASDVKIQLKLGQDSYGIFCMINPMEFKCVISNIINNSIDAVSQKKQGLISVKISSDGKNAIIEIDDNGKGMPDEILKELGQQEKSYKKKEGNGIGVYNACKYIHSCGGQINYKSEENIGTVVSIKLPRKTAPSWFVNKLIIKNDIVILDDDNTIHHVWHERFKKTDMFVENNFKIFDFFNSETFLNWLAENKNKDFTLLTDYELLKDKKNGLDVIEQNQLHHKSIIITSHYEESDLIDRCQSSSISLLPKPMALIIPIEIETLNRE